jgi:hypothetical protein
MAEREGVVEQKGAASDIFSDAKVISSYINRN